MTSQASDLKDIIRIVADGTALSREQSARAFDIMMSGDATPSQIGGLLMALRVRGETVDEITGAAETMRSKALMIDAPAGAVDTVGTGGDGYGTWNISTAAAFIVSACDVPVAKHGNRALSSKSGAADVLSSLKVNVDADMSLVHKALFEAGICFLMAPRHHSAMRHVMPSRVELGTRTIFNLLGPLTNPAGVKRQLVGVFSRHWVEPIAHVLGQLGSEKAWIIHGSDGLDELTTTGASHVAELRNGDVRSFEITPEDAGLPRARMEDLKGGDPETNAKALISLLEGEKGPYRDIVLLNAAATLIVADKVTDLKDGVAMAAEAIDSGKASQKLKQLVDITHQNVA